MRRLSGKWRRSDKAPTLYRPVFRIKQIRIMGRCDNSKLPHFTVFSMVSLHPRPLLSEYRAELNYPPTSGVLNRGPPILRIQKANFLPSTAF